MRSLDGARADSPVVAVAAWSYDGAMELSPKSITGVQFRTVRKGYDPEEVRGFLAQLARGVEAVQAQSAAADSRSRSLMGKLQELSSREEHDPGEAMKRTLLLAQRTADAAVAEANEEARSVLAARRREVARHAGRRPGQGRADDHRRRGRRPAGGVGREDPDRSRGRRPHRPARRAPRRGDPRSSATSATSASGIGAVAGDAAVDPVRADRPGRRPSWPRPARRCARGRRRRRRRRGVVGRAGPAGRDGDPTVAEDLALLAEPAGGLFDDPGPPTAEVPVISGDDELVRGFFEPEPFADERWKGRRAE